MALALSYLPPVKDDRVLVGTNTADDAGIIRISEDRALVHTVDVFAPVVNDPYTFGKIAAINSLSDVYAMGGKPLAALNVVGFPGGMGPEVLGEMLKGGQDAAVEAGVAMLGGHTFQDAEIRYGLAITGEIHPDEIITNAGARAGDVLILTKPLGTGTVIQALVSRGVVSESLYRQAVEVMTTSNAGAAEAMKGIAAACTDVTGFGFLGHCWEMAEASGLSVAIDVNEIPVLPKVLDLIKDGVTDAGMKQNLNSFEKGIEFDKSVPEEWKTLLYGSETSGGFLIACPESKSVELQQNLRNNDCLAQVIGRFHDSGKGKVITTCMKMSLRVCL